MHNMITVWGGILPPPPPHFFVFFIHQHQCFHVEQMFDFDDCIQNLVYTAPHRIKSEKLCHASCTTHILFLKHHSGFSDFLIVLLNNM